MIVRNEEELLPRCLGSTQGIINEIIVVDTGSQDATVAVAHNFGATVLHFEWQDDFAAARNYSLSHARSEWILVLDADEALTESFRQTIGQVLPGLASTACQCLLEDNYDEGIAYEPIVRLFRNLPGIHYRRAYHEALTFDVPDPRVTVCDELVIFHDGYKRLRVQQKDKHTRAIEIMSRHLLVQPEDYYLQVKLAGLLLQTGQAQQAVEHAGLAIAHLSAQANNNDRCEVQTIAATVYAGLGQWEVAAGLAEQAVTIPVHGGLHRQAMTLLGQIWANQQCYDRVLSLCATANLDAMPGLRLAHGWALQHGGDTMQAQREFETVISCSPTNALAWCSLGCLHLQSGRSDQAICALRKAVELAQHDLLNWYHLGRAYLLTEEFLEAERCFESVLQQDTSSQHGGLIDDCRVYLKRIRDNWQYFWANGGVLPGATGCFDRIAAFLLGRELKLLDLGCGDGLLGCHVGELVAGYVGLDMSADALKRAQFWGFETVLADAGEPLPLADGTFGCVAAIHLLPHLSDDRCLQEAWRVLAPGGWLVVAVGDLPPDCPTPRRTYSGEQLTELLESVSGGERVWLMGFEETFILEGERSWSGSAWLAFVCKPVSFDRSA